MPRGRLKVAPIAALAAALAAAAWLVLTPAAASAQQPEDADAAAPDASAAPDADTITTTLYPGWNTAAWLGPEAPVQAIFDAIPALELVEAWDAGEQRRRYARPRSVSPRGLERLTTGMGLWLKIGGGEPVTWTRPARADSVLLELQEGKNLAGWAGRDATPAAEAFARFGVALASVHRWNAKAQRWDRYRPGAPDAANTLRELAHGDAIEVQLTAGARWWQPGTAPPPVEFLGDVPDEEQARIRGWVDETRAVYAERWGVEARFESYVGELEPLTPKYVEIRGGEPRPGFCGNYSRRVVFARLGCISERTYPHEYFHVLQDALRGDRNIHVPTWLVEGTAGYGEVTQQGVVSESSTVDEHIDRNLRSRIATLIRNDLPSLASIEDPAKFHEYGIVGYDMGFVAVDWLVDHSTEESIVDVFKALAAPSATWQEAFEAAFGIAVEDFYAAFEPYIREAAPPLPHLTDDGDEPVLVFLGDVASATEAAVRAEFGRVRAFFTDRFGAETPDFTAYVVADADSASATHLRVFGEQPEDGFCDRSGDAVAIIVLACREAAPHSLDWHYVSKVRDRLAPWGSLPPAPEGHGRRGPDWLFAAVGDYIKSAYRDAAGIDTRDRIRAVNITAAGRTAVPLSSLETRADVAASGVWRARGLGFLAAERLVARAGEPALFAYYRALPASATWQEAFETAFGIAAGDFYAAFEAYRAEVAPPLPHLTDDGDEPVLVFLGDVPSAVQAAVRAEFGRVRAFFTDRFGAETPDFTAYVGADAESAAATHLRVFGEQPEDGFCDRSIRGLVVIVVLGCGESPLHHLDRHYFNAVRAKIAPWGSLPAVPEGSNRLGPDWLLLATESYTESAYRAAAGIETFSRIRDRERSYARQTRQPLSSMETRAGVDAAVGWRARAVSFMAAERLVGRAGEPALLAYYRALPSSASWQEAFEAAFGLSADEFYAAFERHRADVLPVAYEVRGAVLGPDGQPRAGVWVGANRGEADWENTTHTGTDGTFAMAVRNGRYSLTTYLDGVACRQGARFAVNGADVSGVTIRLPAGSPCA